LFENLVEISEIPSAFAGLYGPFDEEKLWVGKGVIDPMFLAPTNEFSRRYRTSFKRGLRVPVIFALNLVAKIGERSLNGRHELLDDLQMSVIKASDNPGIEPLRHQLARQHLKSSRLESRDINASTRPSSARSPGSDFVSRPIRCTGPPHASR
jgi:hypothetical protein